MKLKRVCAFCASALMLASSALPASAVESYDPTVWNFDISYNQTSYTTGPRPKRDTSGTYVYYEGGTPASLRCDVLNGYGQSMCDSIGSISLGQKGLIAQYVYEEGHRSAKLKLTSSTTYGGAGGEWSPDSVDPYPYIN